MTMTVSFPLFNKKICL